MNDDPKKADLPKKAKGWYKEIWRLRNTNVEVLSYKVRESNDAVYYRYNWRYVGPDGPGPLFHGGFNRPFILGRFKSDLDFTSDADVGREVERLREDFRRQAEVLDPEKKALTKFMATSTSFSLKTLPGSEYTSDFLASALEKLSASTVKELAMLDRYEAGSIFTALKSDGRLRFNLQYRTEFTIKKLVENAAMRLVHD
jgi:hypothetical protein